jgi:hypothetical protein
MVRHPAIIPLLALMVHCGQTPTNSLRLLADSVLAGRKPNCGRQDVVVTKREPQVCVVGNVLTDTLVLVAYGPSGDLSSIERFWLVSGDVQHNLNALTSVLNAMYGSPVECRDSTAAGPPEGYGWQLPHESIVLDARSPARWRAPYGTIVMDVPAMRWKVTSDSLDCDNQRAAQSN